MGETVKLSWSLGMASAVVVALGYPGEIQDNLAVRWFWWAMAMIPFSYVVMTLEDKVEEEKRRGEQEKDLDEVLEKRERKRKWRGKEEEEKREETEVQEDKVEEEKRRGKVEEEKREETEVQEDKVEEEKRRGEQEKDLDEVLEKRERKRK